MLSKFLSRIWPRDTQRSSKRDAKRVEIESLGFQLVDLRGWHEGKYAERRYHLVNSRGEIFDNRGLGFRSSTAALAAAREMSELNTTQQEVTV